MFRPPHPCLQQRLYSKRNVGTGPYAGADFNLMHLISKSASKSSYQPQRQPIIQKWNNQLKKGEYEEGEVKGWELTLTINAPLILKMRDIIFFFAGKLHNGPF